MRVGWGGCGGMYVVMGVGGLVEGEGGVDFGLIWALDRCVCLCGCFPDFLESYGGLRD